MKRYTFPATCSVCGCEGALQACDLGADWLGEVRHRDPEVCAENLRRERIELDKMKQLRPQNTAGDQQE